VIRLRKAIMPASSKEDFLRVERNLFEYADRSGIGEDGVLREDARTICFCSSLDIPNLNLAYLKARPEEADLKKIELFFRERGNPYTIWIPENGVTVGSDMTELGLNHSTSMPAMLADLDVMRLDQEPPHGIHLQSVRTESDMGAFARAAFNGFELPVDVREKFTDLILKMDPIKHPSNEIVVAMRGDEPVASGLMFRGEADIGLYWISVVPHQRNRGMGSWLAQELLRIGKGEGYHHAVLQSSVEATAVYRRLGFREVGNFHVYSH
jgi:ribosomal protein S18 acetylase RimI-like enzyme